MLERSLEERIRLPYVAFPMTLEGSELMMRIPEGYRRLDGYLGEHQLEDRGPAIIRYRRGSERGPWDIEVGWVMDVAIEIEAPFVVDVLPEGTYLVGWHDGPYSRIRATTLATIAWGLANGVDLDVETHPDGDQWACNYELYVDDPAFGPDGPEGAVEVCLLTRG